VAKSRRELSVPERHQLRVALDTLKMNDVMARVMGGPSKEEAREIVKRLTGKTPRKNPALSGMKVLAPNVTELRHGSNLILYSYNTPVAIVAPSGRYRTSQKWSTTTSRHINRWFQVAGLDPKDALALPQDVIESYAASGVDPVSQRGKNPPRRRGNPLEYRTVDTTTVKGIEEAEKLQAAGWKMIRPGMFSIQFERKTPPKKPRVSRRSNPRRRSAKTKKIASSYLRKRYEFFRKPSVAGIQIERPASAQQAKALADAERWAYDSDVDFRYYYGADAGEEEEWRGRIEAVHPDGTVAEEYGYLGDDWNQAHVKAGAALALMRAMGGRRKGSRRTKNPKRGKVVRVRKRRVVLRRAGNGRMVRRSNPVIGVLGNPPHDGKYLGKVTYIEYTHGHDGQRYYHEFQPAVYAQVTDDGGVRLWHPTNKLWKLFPEPK
jgi:hypothetical protein